MTDIAVANEDDASVLSNISLMAFKEDYDKYGSYPTGIESSKWHESQIKKGNYYKIKFDDVVVGGIDLICKESDHIEVGLFYISPDYQNKKIGVSTINLVEKKYPNIRKWSLVTPYKDYRNHHFYEKLGYVKIGEYRPEPDSDFTLYEYEKIV